MDAHLIPFVDGWFFLRTELGATLREAQGRVAEFAPVELPHDWLIYHAKDLYQDGCGWYRKTFSLDGGKDPAERFLLRFEGVYMDSTLYVNETKIGDWKYGYSTFDMDITDALRLGDNEILLQVRHQSPNSRWYSGAGIYRRVWMKRCGKAYLPLDGTYVSISPCEGGFQMEVETELGGSAWERASCHYSLWQGDELVKDFGAQKWIRSVAGSERAGGEADGAGSEADGAGSEANGARGEADGARSEADGAGNEADGARGEADGAESDARSATGASRSGVHAGAAGLAGIDVFVENPKLWDIDDPQCYQLRVSLQDGDGVEQDRQDVTVGFRTFAMDSQKGFFLNGRPVKIHGVCEHHDLGCLGAAFHKPAMVRKLRILKEMGCNAIRTSHNMPATEWMELADEMGFLVLDEAFDMWERSKTEYDYARFFKEWYQADVRSWVRRDRNHPCLLMWSVGNEIYDTHADERGQEVTRELVAAVRVHDPKKNAPVTIGSNYMPWEGAQKCAEFLDVVGYNYGEDCYRKHHEEHPDWVIYGSETASLVHSRGIYRFPYSQSVLSDDDEQCSSLGNSCTSWGAKSWEACIVEDRDCEFVLGQFLWTGFDYIGEPTPYHTKNSYFGMIDTAGFPKDPYYFFQSQWTDVATAPMVHLFPYWDFNPGQRVDVRACTNAPSVELFLDGESQGVRRIDHAHGTELTAGWELTYRPGTITAVAYDENGNEVARESRSSFSESRQIVLTPDKATLVADGEDLCFLTVEMEDEQGRKVENASDYVKISLDGPGRILGMDNGDSTDYDEYKTNVRKLFSGKLLVVVGNTGQPGTITVTAEGKGLLPAKATLEVAACEAGKQAGIQHFLEDCRSLPTTRETLPERVPIRKLELRALNGQIATPGHQELLVEAVLYPADTTDRKLVWKAVNQIGVEVNYAKVESQEVGEDGEVGECKDRRENIGRTDGGGVDERKGSGDDDGRKGGSESGKCKDGGESGKCEDGSESGKCKDSGDGRMLARVKTFGDGDFLVRCMAENEDGKTVLISQLECRAEGLGQAYLDPYGFVSGGLYTRAYGQLGNGNEKGVASDREKESGPVFDHVDFGEFGSDELTISIFALDDKPYPIDIWLGMPHEEGSRLIDTVTYQKPSIWNTYQPETYKLPERIKGLCTIAFTLRDKVHIKGFCFTRPQKAYERLWASDASAIYGDSFTRDGKAVRGIGNNVVIAYEDMDFGEDGASTLTICGGTGLANNTIHLQFTDGQGNASRQAMEFAGTSGGCQERTFALEKLRGKGKVELVFLPGSSFDLEYVQFNH